MAVNPLTRDHLRSLAEARPERGRVLSVFLNLDPSEFASPAARSTAINSVLTQAEHGIGQLDDVEHDELVSLREDLERVRAELNRDDLAVDGTRGVAVYACGPAGLLQTVGLREPVDSHVVIDRTPCIEPLARSASQENWGVLLSNRRSARLFRGSPSTLEETDRIEDDVHSQHQQGGWSQARYQRSVDKEVENHIKHVAEVAFDAHKHGAFDSLLIGAPEETVGDLESALHPYLRERIRGRLQVDVEHSSADDVRAAAGDAIARYHAQREQELLERLNENLGRNMRAASGLTDVLAALNEARVETLLVRDNFHEAGVRDPRTGMLGREGAPSADGGPTEQVDDVIPDAMQKAVEQSAEIVVVQDPESLVEHGGIAALLRF
jgi:peptide subunit release factor 1 (eRF1)